MDVMKNKEKEGIATCCFATIFHNFRSRRHIFVSSAYFNFVMFQSVCSHYSCIRVAIVFGSFKLSFKCSFFFTHKHFTLLSYQGVVPSSTVTVIIVIDGSSSSYSVNRHCCSQFHHYMVYVHRIHLLLNSVFFFFWQLHVNYRHSSNGRNECMLNSTVILQINQFLFIFF